MIDDSNLEDRLRAAEWILNHPELNEPKNHAQEYIDFTTSHGHQDVLSKLIAAGIKNTAQLSDNEAINVKRSGDLIKSNELYIEFAAYNDVFDAEPMWGWFKIMLLAKNFSDAYVLLKYYHAIATSLNFLMRNEGLLDFSNAKISESFLTFDFDSHAVFCLKTDIYNLTYKAVVDKIRAFGGSEIWSSYTLSDTEYANFTKYFG